MPEAVEEERAPFEVGACVEVVERDYRDPEIGQHGLVRAFVAGLSTYAVEFDQPMSGAALHSCGGAVPSGLGRFMRAHKLKLVDLVRSNGAAPKAFQLIVLDPGAKTGRVIPNEEFDNGRDASDRAKVLSREIGCKVQARRTPKVDADAWRDRERKRLVDGTYAPMPEAWDLPPIEDHFLHLSPTKGWVTYTPSPEYGEHDRHQSLRPGSYLKKHASHLSDRDVERLSAIVTCDGQLFFATTEKEIERVYRTGPASCMSGLFEDQPHPSRVYAAGDLAVAYLKDDEGRIRSRCVCWPEKKRFTRAYGDVAKIVSQLKAQGFTQENLYGARLQKIVYEDRYGDRIVWVMPYLDEASSVCGDPDAVCVREEDDHFIISDRGYLASGTDGYIDEDNYSDAQVSPRARCPHCEERCHESDLDPVRIGSNAWQDWCESCRDCDTFYCEGLGENVSDAIDYHDDAYGRTVSSIFVDLKDYVFCEASGVAYPSDRTVKVIVDRRGTEQVWGRDYFDDNGFTCAGDGRNYSGIVPHTEIDDLVYADHNLPKVETKAPKKPRRRAA